jgi:hypothetical protein
MGLACQTQKRPDVSACAKQEKHPGAALFPPNAAYFAGAGGRTSKGRTVETAMMPASTCKPLV